MTKPDKAVDETTPADTNPEQTTEFIEQGLSLLAQAKLDELAELADELGTKREEVEQHGTLSAQLEADKQECIRIQAENEARAKELDTVGRKQQERIGGMETAYATNLARAAELDRREQHVGNRETAADTREKQLDIKAENLLKDARTVADVKAANTEKEQSLEKREKSLEARKAKLREVELSRSGQT